MSESPSNTKSQDDVGTITVASMRSGLKRNRGSEFCKMLYPCLVRFRANLGTVTVIDDSDSRASKETRTIHAPENEPAFAPEEYTVGWVCALPLEMAVNSHIRQPRKTHDANVPPPTNWVSFVCDVINRWL
jgi:hypothetical protein